MWASSGNKLLVIISSSVGKKDEVIHMMWSPCSHLIDLYLQVTWLCFGKCTSVSNMKNIKQYLCHQYTAYPFFFSCDKQFKCKVKCFLWALVLSVVILMNNFVSQSLLCYSKMSETKNHFSLWNLISQVLFKLYKNIFKWLFY